MSTVLKKQPLNLEKVYYAVVTGASRGIGKTISIDLAKKFANKSVIVLIARSEDGLKDTENEILALNRNIVVYSIPCDLTKPCAENFSEMFWKTTEGFNLNEFDGVMIVHNAGSEGDVTKKASELNNLKVWQDYFALNLFECAILNSEFIKFFNKSHNIADESKKMVIVNISSMLGSVPLKSFTFYCCGKASRNMFFKVLALEEPNTLVLSYSPGPVVTDMTDSLVQNISDPDSKKMFQSYRDNIGVEKKGFMTTTQTVAKFLRVLEEGNYESGQYVDYFD